MSVRWHESRLLTSLIKQGQSPGPDGIHRSKKKRLGSRGGPGFSGFAPGYPSSALRLKFFVSKVLGPGVDPTSPRQPPSRVETLIHHDT